MGIADFAAARDLLLARAEAALTAEEACSTVAEAIRRVAPFQAMAVMTTDPETHLPAGGVVSGFDRSDCVPFWDNELLDPDFNKFNDLARSIDRVATLSEATDGDLTRSPRHQKLYGPAGACDELRAAFTQGSSTLAIGAFVRIGGEPFSATEVNDVRNLLVPATNLLRTAMGATRGPSGLGSPVVLLLDAAQRVVGMTEGADVVLDDLRIGVDGDDLPGTIMVAASKARSGRTNHGLTTRLRGRSGRWFRVHVAPMAGDDTVSVSIDTARASDLVPILLESYGLTERETDIVLAVCRGEGTKDIARSLSISVHTVRDHLKAVFDKAGVNSRGELVAGLFSDHVLHDFESTVAHV